MKSKLLIKRCREGYYITNKSKNLVLQFKSLKEVLKFKRQYEKTS